MTNNSSYDSLYGFGKPGSIDEKVFCQFEKDYIEVLQRRENRWKQIYSNGSDHLERGRILKRFVRKGIPIEMRADAWMLLTGAKAHMERNPFLFKTALTVEIDKKYLDVIEVDLPRTFPENVHFSSANTEDSLIGSLKNVLHAMAVTNVDIGYCQGLNFIAAILLLVIRIKDKELAVMEEKAFFLLDAIIKRLPDYYKNNMIDLQADCLVLNELIKRKEPKLHKLLSDSGLEMVVLATKWFICIFADVLPMETVYRIFDCLFYEGDKILFRAALALIKIHQKQIIQCRDMPSIIRNFRLMCQDRETLYCHEFLQEMFRIQLKSKTIQELRAKFRLQVEQERENRICRLAYSAKDGKPANGNCSNSNSTPGKSDQ